MKNYKKGFTLSEVLITLAIIGIIFAICVSLILNSTHEKEYKMARKKVFSTFYNSTRLMAVNGILTSATNSEDFVKNYLSSYINISKICNNNNLEDCGIVTGEKKITALDGTKITMPKNFNNLTSDAGLKSKSHGLVLSNGISINLFYNNTCTRDMNTQHSAKDVVCLNVIYDMNGKKNPNKVGKDIGFVTVLYPDNSTTTVAPDIHKEKSNGTWNKISCKWINKKLSPPNRDEGISIVSNLKIIQPNYINGWGWTTNKFSDDSAWIINYGNGVRTTAPISWNMGVSCIWRE